MAVTVASFRNDFTEFKSEAAFPNSGIAFWLNLGTLLLNQQRWGPPAPYTLTSATPSPNPSGKDYEIGDIINLAGGSFTQGASVAVTTVNSTGGVTACAILAPGQYVSPPTLNPVPQLTTTGDGVGFFAACVFTAAPNSQYDVGLELFIAHNVSLEFRAQQEAQAGGQPGVTTGPVASKSVGGVSVSYDTGSGIIADDGHWNLTVYGTRFQAMVNLYGMGPITVHGRPAPYGRFNGGAWPGPPIDRGYGPSGS